MTRRGFTILELLTAVLILGVISAFSALTFNAVSQGWTSSTEYMDKMQRSDYALNQVVSALKSMYYPHAGQLDYNYGFYLHDGGDGKTPSNSDVIEWAKTGHAVVGSMEASADTVHRVQVMVLEEGDRTYGEDIPVTGLYARLCPDPALRPNGEDGRPSEVDYSFGNTKMYKPVLVADGIVGMNCRVMETPEEAKRDIKLGDEFKDEWEASNSVPYKVELTFWAAGRDGRSARSRAAPMVRIVRIPIFEQSKDAATLPGSAASSGGKDRTKRTRGGR